MAQLGPLSSTGGVGGNGAADSDDSRFRITDLRRRKRDNVKTSTQNEDVGEDHALAGLLDPIEANKMVVANLVSPFNTVNQSMESIWVAVVVTAVLTLAVGFTQLFFQAKLKNMDEEEQESDSGQDTRKWAERIGFPLGALCLVMSVTIGFMIRFSKSAKERISDISDLVNSSTLYFYDRSINACLSSIMSKNDPKLVELTNLAFTSSIDSNIPSVNQAKDGFRGIRMMGSISSFLFLALAGGFFYSSFSKEHLSATLVGVMGTGLGVALLLFLMTWGAKKQIQGATKTHMRWIRSIMDVKRIKKLHDFCDASTSKKSVDMRNLAEGNLAMFEQAINVKHDTEEGLTSKLQQAAMEKLARKFAPELESRLNPSQPTATTFSNPKPDVSSTRKQKRASGDLGALFREG